MREADFVTLDSFMAELESAGVVTAAAALVASRERIVWTGACGCARLRPRRPAGETTRFDLASLTKPFTATLALRLDDSGRLSLGLEVGSIWPRAHPRLARCRLEQLLRHRARLQRWAPLYHLSGDRHQALELLLRGDLLGADPGTYGDLGFILWGFAAEEVLGLSLGEALRSEVLEPLSLQEMVSPGQSGQDDVAECMLDTDVEVNLAHHLGLEIEPLGPPARAAVQDGNARFLGVPAGHAGLFGTVRDLWRLGLEWLQPGAVLDAAGVKAALRGRGRWVLGWRRAGRGGGLGLRPAAFGHNGFTGGSLWIEPEGERIFVLLAHRRDAVSDLDPWRRRFHRVATALANTG